MSHAKLEHALARVALERAHAAYLDGALELTLDALLAAWAAVRDRDLADTIDIVSHAGRELRAPVTDESQWLQRTQGADSIEVGRLLAKLPRRPSLILPGLEALMRGPPDPRLASAAMRLRHLDSWLMGLAPMQAHLDPVYLSTLRALAPSEPDSTRREAMLASLADHEALISLRATELDGGSRAWLEALLTRTPAPDCEDARELALLAAIAERPRELGPRSVYADWLQQRGDPHGEFIVLQLRAAQGPLGPAGEARVCELLDAHEHTWLGKLGRVVVGESFEWRGGFGLRAELVGLDGRPCLSARVETWLETHPGLSTFVQLAGASEAFAAKLGLDPE